MNPLLATDAYKLFHRQMYPSNTSLVYSNWTPRSTKRYPGQEKQGVVVFGVQMMLKKLVREFDQEFFSKDRDTALLQYGRTIREFTGDDSYSVEHVGKLHDLGYLPLVVKSLPEGVICPVGVPCVTVYNTHPDHFWLTNYLETRFSAELWGPMTSASVSREFLKILTEYGVKTGTPVEFIQWQGHDFSMRGMYGVEASALSGIGHLVSFTGTDTIPAYVAAKKYYNGTGLIASSVPASEHSVQCSHYTGDGDEEAYMRYMLDTFPTGIVSIVCDGFDYWKFVTQVLPKFKDEILARDGRVVIRPDSGSIVHMITGWNRNEMKQKHWDDTPIHERKGSMEVLWDIFGGTEVVGADGETYKHLDPHIGLIYGDGVNLERCTQICERLVAKGFSTNNLVLGIGSFTYQFNTRDTMGFAMKATYIEQRFGEHTVVQTRQGTEAVVGYRTVGKEIFKDPKTRGGINKKSLKGLIQVVETPDGYKAIDQVTWEQEQDSALREIFRDGQLLIDEDLETIRHRVKASII